MKRSELKDLIKECLREVLKEDGMLAGMIVEVTKGVMQAGMLTEQRPYYSTSTTETIPTPRPRQPVAPESERIKAPVIESKVAIPSIKPVANKLASILGFDAAAGIDRDELVKMNY